MNTKYALLNSNNAILSILNEQPAQIKPDLSLVEISQECVDTIQNGRTTNQYKPYFYSNGTVITLEQRKEEVHIAAIKAKNEQLKLESRIRNGERHIEESGFTPARLVTCMDILLQTKESGTLNSYPKLVAVYSWLQEVKQIALSSTDKFPQRPFSFEEVLAEQLNNLALNP